MNLFISFAFFKKDLKKMGKKYSIFISDDIQGG